MELPINYTTANARARKAARMEYASKQKGKCWHCGFTLGGGPRPDMAKKVINKNLFPPGFFNNPVHLHHDHKTGMTIGAVHAKCNAVLWQYHGE